MGEKRNANRKCIWESQKDRDHWKDQDIGGWIILK
jgi:hypothetical protein